MLCTLALSLLLMQAPDSPAGVRQQLKKVDPATIPTWIDRAAKEPDAAIRRVIIERLGRFHLPAVRTLLERHAATDPDATVALAALERLRQFHAGELGDLFEKRLAAAHAAGDEKALAVLTPAHQHAVTQARGATLPEFLEQPPAVFAASTKSSIRVVSFGDFGSEGDNQRRVAAAVARYHAGAPFDLGLLLGDNVVPVGVTGLDDPRWKSGWEQLYDTLGIPFYAVTGNHDWGLADSPAAEILYSRQSRSWRMPALYYTFTAGPVQFFALGTQAFSETQARWLERELARSTARWKIVYGHHPVYSHAGHGENARMERLLLPVLRGRADVYLSGHDHVFQHLKPVDGCHFLVNAAAGQSARDVETGPNTLAADSFYGFTMFEANGDRLTITAVDTELKTRYTTTLQR